MALLHLPIARIEGMGNDLLDEERVAFGPPVNPGHQRVVDRSGEDPDQRRRGALIQPTEREPGDEVVPAKLVQGARERVIGIDIGLAMGRHDQERPVTDAPQ